MAVVATPATGSMIRAFELTALFLAGLSFFFTGISGVKSKLQQLSGRRFRQMLGRVTDRPILAGLVGIMFGAVTQSASAVAFILSGMVATGLISLRRALPVVAASNLGTALLVFLAALDLNLAVLAVIGFTGLMINFRIASRLEPVFGAFFAVALLFFGLGLMKQAFVPLSGSEGFRAFALFLKDFPLAPFLFGAALRMVIQSSSAIGVIAIALLHAGIFGEFESVMLICGAGPGVTLSGLFLSGTLTGPPRQIVLYQGVINFASGAIFGVLFTIWNISGHWHLFDSYTAPNARIATVFFLTMSGCLVIGLLIMPFIEPILSRLAPPTVEQDLSRPLYLHPGALDVPGTAIDLLEKEQLRYFEMLVAALDTVRREAVTKTVSEAAFHNASLSLRQEIRGFVEDLIHRGPGSEMAGAILSIERRQENLDSLMDTMHQFVGIRSGVELSDRVSGILERLGESLHLIMLTARDAWVLKEPEDLRHLLTLTEDRGDLMERIRKTHQGLDTGEALGQSSMVFYATTLFERTVWLLRQLGLSLQNRS